MDHQFSDLRRAIYINEVEFRRFRELVVNTVLATDIMDKELGQLRKKRWNDAFSADTEQQAAAAADEAAKTYSTNRKATIVLEHLIQSSDVSHTMQVSDGMFLLARCVWSYSLCCCVCHLTVCFVFAFAILLALARVSQVECQTLSRNVPSLRRWTCRA